MDILARIYEIVAQHNNSPGSNTVYNFHELDNELVLISGSPDQGYIEVHVAPNSPLVLKEMEVEIDDWRVDDDLTLIDVVENVLSSNGKCYGANLWI